LKGAFEQRSPGIQNFGRIRSNYRLSKAQEQETLTNYQNAILKALQDVSDFWCGTLAEAL
jgi:outer membrane protein TolC